MTINEANNLIEKHHEIMKKLGMIERAYSFTIGIVISALLLVIGLVPIEVLRKFIPHFIFVNISLISIAPFVAVALLFVIIGVCINITRGKYLRKLEDMSFLAHFGGLLKEHECSDLNLLEMVLKSQRKEVSFPGDTASYYSAVESLIIFVSELEAKQVENLKNDKLHQLQKDLKIIF